MSSRVKRSALLASLPLVLLLALAAVFGPGAASAEGGKEPGSKTDPLAGVSLAGIEIEDGRYTRRFEDGRTAVFTLDPRMQRYADDLFERYEVPAGAAVMIASRTGRVLALSQHRLEENAADSDAVALDPSPPAASLFKIVTTAALLDGGETDLDERVCYHGGWQELTESNLVDSPRLDTACADLASALGRSINAVFAKLADRRLERSDIAAAARRFGFGRELPFDLPLAESRAEIPGDRLERARAAAGFWHTHLSPLHAAMIAQSIAQDGAMLRPYIVDEIISEDGRTLYESEPAFVSRVTSREHAARILEAMRLTVERGTARRAFRDPESRPLVGDVAVAGKTGTLTGRDPYRGYTWFVGIAPAERPEVALAVLVVNRPAWRIKAATASALLLREYFSRPEAAR